MHGNYFLKKVAFPVRLSSPKSAPLPQRLLQVSGTGFQPVRAEQLCRQRGGNARAAQATNCTCHGARTSGRAGRGLLPLPSVGGHRRTQFQPGGERLVAALLVVLRPADRGRRRRARGTTHRPADALRILPRSQRQGRRDARSTVTGRAPAGWWMLFTERRALGGEFSRTPRRQGLGRRMAK